MCLCEMLFLTLKVVFLIQHIGLPPTLYWLDCHLSHLYLYCVYGHLRTACMLLSKCCLSLPRQFDLRPQGDHSFSFYTLP